MLPFATSRFRSLPLLLLGSALLAQNPAPAPTPPKGPDKEVAEKIATLKECIADRKLARDVEGVQIVDFLLQKLQAGTLEPKDKAAVVKVFGEVFTGGKVRPHDHAEIYRAAAAALGYCGVDGAKALKAAYMDKRFPEKQDWVALRGELLKNLGRTKDESMVKFLCNEAKRHPEAALQAAAGDALGNFEDSKEAIRKEVVSELLTRYGELNQLASQTTTSLDQQNAADRLATLKGPWNATLAKLTGQSFDKFGEWQQWYNKHKGQPW